MIREFVIWAGPQNRPGAWVPIFWPRRGCRSMLHISVTPVEGPNGVMTACFPIDVFLKIDAPSRVWRKDPKSEVKFIDTTRETLQTPDDRKQYEVVPLP